MSVCLSVCLTAAATAAAAVPFLLPSRAWYKVLSLSQTRRVDGKEVGKQGRRMIENQRGADIFWFLFFPLIGGSIC